MIIYSADREVCNCGGRGCAERMCSVERVRALVDEFGPDFPPSPLKAVQAELTIPQLFDYSRSGDLLAQHIVKGMAWVFASTIRNTSLAFDPDIIIFQGDYACADQVFKDRLTEEFTKFRYLADHPFEIYYDRQPLRELDAQGSYLAIARRYFRLQEVVGAE